MEPLQWDRILAPTDLSPFSNQAVRYAHALAEKFSAELHVLHVVRDSQELIAEHGIASQLDPENHEEEFDHWLASLLGEEGNIRRVEAVRMSTDAAGTIVKYAQSNSIGLIVIATHGRGGLSHLLMGSITEHVLRKADCPVLVIRPTDKK